MDQSSQEPHRNPWTRLSRRTIYENPWITLYDDRVLRPDGSPGIYGVVHFRHLAVGVVALDDAGNVLLVGQYRYTLDRYSWEIPEGGAPFGEDPLEAARRELREETGFGAAEWRELIRAHLSNSVSDEVAIIYLAKRFTPGAASPEPSEDLRTQWVPLREALARIESGEITDSMTIIGLQRVALMGMG